MYVVRAVADARARSPREGSPAGREKRVAEALRERHRMFARRLVAVWNRLGIPLSERQRRIGTSAVLTHASEEHCQLLQLLADEAEGCHPRPASAFASSSTTHAELSAHEGVLSATFRSSRAQLPTGSAYAHRFPALIAHAASSRTRSPHWDTSSTAADSFFEAEMKRPHSAMDNRRARLLTEQPGLGGGVAVARQLDFKEPKRKDNASTTFVEDADPLKWASTVSSMSGSASITGSPKRGELAAARAAPAAVDGVDAPRVGAWRHERPPTRRGVKGAPEVKDRLKVREINEAETTRRTLIEDDATTQLDILYLLHCQAQMNLETQLLSADRLPPNQNRHGETASNPANPNSLPGCPAYIYQTQRSDAQRVVVEDYFHSKHERLLMLEQLHRMKLERAALLGPSTFRDIFGLGAIEAQSRAAIVAEYRASDAELWNRLSGFLSSYLDARPLSRLVYTGQYRIEQEERAARQFLHEAYRRRFKALLDLLPAVNGEAEGRRDLKMLEESTRDLMRQTEEERRALAEQMQRSRQTHELFSITTNESVVRAYWTAEEVHRRCQNRVALARRLVGLRLAQASTYSDREGLTVKIMHLLQPLERIESIVAQHLERHAPRAHRATTPLSETSLSREDELTLLESARREEIIWGEAVSRCEGIALPYQIARDKLWHEVFAEAAALLSMEVDNTFERLAQDEATVRAHLPGAAFLASASDLEARCLEGYERIRTAEVDAWAHIPVDLLVLDLLSLEGEESSIRQHLALEEDDRREEAATEEVGDYVVARAEIQSLHSRTVELASVILQRFIRRILRAKKFRSKAVKRPPSDPAQEAVEQERLMAAQVLQRTHHRLKEKANAKAKSPRRDTSAADRDATQQERHAALEMLEGAVAYVLSARVVQARRGVRSEDATARLVAFEHVQSPWELLHVEAEFRCDVMLHQANERVRLGELRAAYPIRREQPEGLPRRTSAKTQFTEPDRAEDDASAPVSTALTRRQTQLPAAAESNSASPSPGYTTRTNSVDGGIVSVLNSSMVTVSATPGQVSPAASASSAATLTVPHNSIASSASSTPGGTAPNWHYASHSHHHPYSLPTSPPRHPRGEHHASLPPVPNNSIGSDAAWQTQTRSGNPSGSNTPTAAGLRDYYRYGREGHVAPNNSVTSEMAGGGQSHLVVWTASESWAGPEGSSTGASGSGDHMRSSLSNHHYQDGTAAPNNSLASLAPGMGASLAGGRAPNNSVTSEYFAVDQAGSASDHPQREGRSLHPYPRAPNNSVASDALQWTDRPLDAVHLSASRTTTPNTSFTSYVGGGVGGVGRSGITAPNNSVTSDVRDASGTATLVVWTATDNAEVSYTTVPNNSLAGGGFGQAVYPRRELEGEPGTIAPNNSMSSRPPSPAWNGRGRDTDGVAGFRAPNNSVTTEYFAHSPPIESAGSSTSSLAWADGARAPNSSVTTESAAWALRSPDPSASQSGTTHEGMVGFTSPVPRAPNNSTTTEWIPTPSAGTPRQRFNSVPEPSDPLEATATFDPHESSASATDIGPAAPHSSLAAPPVYTYQSHRGVETFTEDDMKDSPLRRQGSKTTFLGRRRSSSGGAGVPPPTGINRPRALSGGGRSVTQPLNPNQLDKSEAKGPVIG